MKKSEIRSRMTDYLEGDLPLSERALVDAHLDANQDMAREVAEMRETVDLLRSLPEPEPGIDLAQSVMARLEAGEGKPPLWVRARRRLGDGAGMKWAVPVLATSALAAVAVVRGDIELPWADPAAAPAIEVADASRAAAPSVAPTRRPAARPVERIRRGIPRALAMQEPQRPGNLVEVREEPAPSMGGAAAPEIPVMAEARPRPVQSPIPSLTLAPVVTVDSSTSGLPARSLPVPSGTFGAGLERAVSDSLALAPERGASPEGAERGQAQLDERLDLLLTSPASFGQWLQANPLSARELWIPKLAERAVARGVEERALAALRSDSRLETMEMAELFASSLEARSEVVARDLTSPAEGSSSD